MLKFYAKNRLNVTYVKFMLITRLRPGICGLAHSL